jgi:hypothetical protein
MGLGTNHTTLTTSDKFIPEVWSDEVLARYKASLVLGNLVTKVNFKGKKGDTLHIPVPARGTPSAKAASTQVTLIADTATAVDVLINNHYEYSKLYEDIAEMQSLASMRRFYTDDGGYALAKQVDQDLMLMGHYFNDGNTTVTATNAWETGVIGGDGETAFSGAATGNGTALTDAGLRKAIQTLEDNDVASNELKLVIPPVEAAVLRGISRFTEQAFVGNGNVIKTGMLGNLYGVEVFVSSNCPWIHVDGDGNQATNFSGTSLSASITDAYGLSVDFTNDTDTKYRACLLMHKDAVAHAEQMGIRTQAQYKQEYLGTLVTSDTVYGVKTLRDYAGLAIIVPA